MIDIIAMILSILGTPMIAMRSAKRRLIGFIIWILGNALWMIFWSIQNQWPAFYMFLWYQLWCVVGVIGCYKTMVKENDPIQ